MSDRNTSCAERIEGELVKIEQGYAELWRRLDNQDASGETLGGADIS